MPTRLLPGNIWRMLDDQDNNDDFPPSSEDDTSGYNDDDDQTLSFSPIDIPIPSGVVNSNSWCIRCGGKLLPSTGYESGGHFANRTKAARWIQLWPVRDSLARSFCRVQYASGARSIVLSRAGL